ncbi:tail fiber domain-containing protein [Pseudomonas nitroreducens]|uniref:tail fiber domain-containing protein n=1 Tax=Pseudomonas nitroreducens TaxID=46680 RepID=UPI0003794CB6|nr:tail fiber domain-containing protein [Pseudomonas nitroreducens]
MANSNILMRLQYTGSAVTAAAEYQPGETAVLPGSLNFNGNGRRVTGDMAAGAGSFANRLFFQSTVGTQTRISVMPPAGNNSSGVQLWNNAADLENAARFDFGIDNTQAFLSSAITGTGTYLPLAIYTGGAERMRVATNGDVWIGANTSDPINAGTKGVSWQSGPGLLQVRSGSASVAAINFGAPAGVANLAGFFSATTGVGSITTNGTTTAYNTSSDYRLKDDVQPLDAVEATERVMAYRPVTWVWKTDGSYGKGFIAHECQAVDPMTATGTKDAVEQIGDILLADGTVAAVEVREPEDPSIYGEGATWELTGERPVYQGRDDSKMIPDMVAMMQRMELRIRELEAQLQQVIALLPAA